MFLSQVTQLFRSKWLNFVLKSWVTGGTKIRLNFLSQNDSIFPLNAPREKIAVHYAYDQSFWFKIWIDHRKNSFERSVYESVHDKRIK